MMRGLMFATLIALPFWSNSQDKIHEVIEKVFYHERVFKIIFFHYKELNDTPFPLPEISVAFIIPDTTFQTLYPDIIYDMAAGWGRERLMHTKTYIRRDQGSVLINNGFYMNPSMRLLVRILVIRFSGNKAYLEFTTTSQFFHDDMSGRYVRVKADLTRKNDGWKVRRLLISEEPWTGYMFPDDELYDDRRNKGRLLDDH